ncbi:MAG: hypothetical protein FJZ13_03005 [Candidatus Omnitrophica bacterium]|nr:hypothetical protein [Candidatus Omnitrophota bacterium]
MRLSKFLSIIGAITFLSCLYVYQQSEILRLAYVGQKQRAAFEDLLDKNSFLRYNLEKGISLVSIGDRVSKASGFQMPDAYRLVRLESRQQNLRQKAQQGPTANRNNIVARLFGIKRQAEAKTINP